MPYYQLVIKWCSEHESNVHWGRSRRPASAFGLPEHINFLITDSLIKGYQTLSIHHGISAKTFPIARFYLHLPFITQTLYLSYIGKSDILPPARLCS